MTCPIEFSRHPLFTAIAGAVVGALLTIVGTLLIRPNPDPIPPVQPPPLTIAYTYDVDLLQTLSSARLTVVNASTGVLRSTRIWINDPPPLNGPAAIDVIGGSDGATTACVGFDKPDLSPTAIAIHGFCAIVPELLPGGTVTVILPADPKQRFDPEAPEQGYVGVVANDKEIPRIKLTELMRNQHAPN